MMDPEGGEPTQNGKEVNGKSWYFIYPELQCPVVEMSEFSIIKEIIRLPWQLKNEPNPCRRGIVSLKMQDN